MDRVRFGRALGGGAREAAKALVKAAEAASSPNPAAAGPPAPGRNVAGTVGRVAGRGVEQARVSAAGVKHGGRRFGEAVWGPLVKQSGVLWLEFTGVFFGLFAVTAGLAVWKSRWDLLGTGAGQQRAWFAVAMLLVFGYFTVSSFVRARRRGRK